MRDLKKELDSYTGHPPTWKPNPGDVLVGVVASYHSAKTRYGDRTVAEVRTGDGQTLSVWLTAASLRRQFETLRPKVGETVGIKYLGKDDADTYHRYHVKLDRADLPAAPQSDDIPF